VSAPPFVTALYHVTGYQFNNHKLSRTKRPQRRSPIRSTNIFCGVSDKVQCHQNNSNSTNSSTSNIPLKSTTALNLTIAATGDCLVFLLFRPRTLCLLFKLCHVITYRNLTCSRQPKVERFAGISQPQAPLSDFLPLPFVAALSLNSPSDA